MPTTWIIPDRRSKTRRTRLYEKATEGLRGRIQIGSRKQSAKPTSIWGNVDLKAISLEVAEDASGQTFEQAAAKNANTASSSLRTREQILTKTIEQSDTALPPQEKRMAEETTQSLMPKARA
jgi:hypothetical protein